MREKKKKKTLPGLIFHYIRILNDLQTISPIYISALGKVGGAPGKRAWA